MALLGFATPAWAQAPGSGPANEHPSSFSAGYEVVRDSGLWFPVGFYADFALGIQKNLSVVGEFNDAFKNLTLSGIRVNLSVSEFVGGVRFSATNSKQVTPFFQALLGLGRTGGGGSMSGVNVGVSSNGAAFDFGGGADIKAGRKSAVRVAAGLRHLSSSLGNANEFYLKFGISFTTRR